MAIVTISRLEARRGEDVAAEAARRLGFRLSIGLSCASCSTATSPAAIGRLHEPRTSAHREQDEEERAVHAATEGIIWHLAFRENLVLLGFGGQFLFRGCPGTLHVRLTAALEFRPATAETQGHRGVQRDSSASGAGAAAAGAVPFRRSYPRRTLRPGPARRHARRRYGGCAHPTGCGSRRSRRKRPLRGDPGLRPRRRGAGNPPRPPSGIARTDAFRQRQRGRVRESCSISTASPGSTNQRLSPSSGGPTAGSSRASPPTSTSPRWTPSSS